MAEFEWTRPTAPSAARAAPQWLKRLTARLTDWEDWLTLVVALAATMSVSLGLEQSGWSDDMPPITIVAVLAIVASLLIARSGLSILAAWPLAVLTGGLIVFWQTLEMVGPGDFEQRLDAVYTRFDTWFDLAIHGGVSNDSLPFNVLVLGLTWLGVFIFGWSVYRWHNAWIGLIPGGLTLFLDMALVGDNLEGSVLLYILFGFLLVMRTNLMTRMTIWRRNGTSYPSLISLSFLNFSTWALLFLIVTAWILPVGPFTTPGPVDAMVRQIEKVGVNFVRLSGPLHVKRVVPVHNFTGVLPFQGSIDLGNRELMTVRVNDPGISGQIRLRGAVYDEYAGGGWKAGARTSVDLPPYEEALVPVGQAPEATAEGDPCLHDAIAKTGRVDGEAEGAPHHLSVQAPQGRRPARLEPGVGVEEDEPIPGGPAGPGLTLTTSAFADGAEIPARDGHRWPFPPGGGSGSLLEVAVTSCGFGEV